MKDTAVKESGKVSACGSQGQRQMMSPCCPISEVKCYEMKKW